jgi:hypothetical protein
MNFEKIIQAIKTLSVSHQIRFFSLLEKHPEIREEIFSHFQEKLEATKNNDSQKIARLVSEEKDYLQKLISEMQ